jgi:hypothetical protein
MLSALDRRFAGPYTFTVPNGTRNSSEEITTSRTIKFTKAGGPEVLEFIETKVKAPGPRGQTEIHPTKTGELICVQ